MKKNYPILYILLILIFVSGCSTVSNDRTKDVERKINEIRVLTQDLQERIDELSTSILLVVNDGNEDIIICETVSGGCCPLEYQLPSGTYYAKDISDGCEDIPGGWIYFNPCNIYQVDVPKCHP